MVDRRSYEEVIAEREKSAHQPQPYEAGHENHLEKTFPLPPMPDKFRRMRIFCTLLALFLVVYGGYGLAIDDLVLPLRRGAAKHLHGVNAWVAVVGLYFAAAALWVLVLNLRPGGLGKRRFILRALVVAALICLLAAPFFQRMNGDVTTGYARL